MLKGLLPRSFVTCLTTTNTNTARSPSASSPSLPSPLTRLLNLALLPSELR